MSKTSLMQCSQCGLCCKLFLINLNEEEYRSRKYVTQFEGFKVDDFEEAELCGANIIASKDDGCFYLKDGKCSIHNMKPVSCKNFYCGSKDPKFSTMIEKINQSRRLCN